jgi:hypothetical protein
VSSNYSLALEVYINNNKVTVLHSEKNKKQNEIKKLKDAVTTRKYTVDDLRKLEKY